MMALDSFWEEDGYIVPTNLMARCKMPLLPPPCGIDTSATYDSIGPILKLCKGRYLRIAAVAAQNLDVQIKIADQHLSSRPTSLILQANRVSRFDRLEFEPAKGFTHPFNVV